ncbi:GlcNAc-PI de-N-acetylase [Paenibacillus darwinianus]|uniref:GlcNAc-PI de-N-acetylase n=1 Tax=Paenibacillus darwinianus TaxID=1380763 RepID=A0A9W5W7C0_9BACL|nr:PIG-L family deacetylase [Paenibacillus darwinianus]EXX87677.1 GlcNAc-PI de-N-acetylase [Paenibacillus darwinianus]EXX90064.1 GlcNAc-PI de-N-acetylase [Paenibacillus darwinianus]EXX90888.1 GlcNAc-PI de-N-acetylase [Paenibacillus darwinianus]
MDARTGFVYAHPDDESFLSAALIRSLADRGREPVLLLATRGDAGQNNGDYRALNRRELGELREREMAEAAKILGLAGVEYLGYPDGKLKEAEREAFVSGVAAFINRHWLDTVFTFPEDGGNFHPDHRAISDAVTTAVTGGRCPSVEKLFVVFSDTLAAGGVRTVLSVDVLPLWEVKRAALQAHSSQIEAIKRYFGDLHECPDNRRYESFALRWMNGQDWPETGDTALFGIFA